MYQLSKLKGYIKVCIHSYHEDTGLLPIHKALRDSIWCEDLISEITLGENKLETKIIQEVYRYY